MTQLGPISFAWKCPRQSGAKRGRAQTLARSPASARDTRSRRLGLRRSTEPADDDASRADGSRVLTAPREGERRLYIATRHGAHRARDRGDELRCKSSRPGDDVPPPRASTGAARLDRIAASTSSSRLFVSRPIVMEPKIHACPSCLSLWSD